MNKKHFEAAVKFGVRLIQENDLDPIYVILHRANLPQDQLKRLVLAYSCLYHLGGAAYLSEFKGKKFWDWLTYAAANLRSPFGEGRWPRGTERRHWRGMNAAASTGYFKRTFKEPEDAINHWFPTTCNLSFKSVMSRVQEAAGFGPWIAFKMADVGERVLGYPIDFSDCHLDIYSEPMKGAGLIFHGSSEVTSPEALKIVVENLQKAIYVAYPFAPPDYKRAINIQEIETVLCKYKSHCNGHYEVGKDKHEVFHGLVPTYDKNMHVVSPWGATASKLAEIVKSLI